MDLKTDSTSNFSGEVFSDKLRTNFIKDPIQTKTATSSGVTAKTSRQQPTNYADQFKALHHVKLTKQQMQEQVMPINDLHLFQSTALQRHNNRRINHQQYSGQEIWTNCVC